MTVKMDIVPRARVTDAAPCGRCGDPWIHYFACVSCDGTFFWCDSVVCRNEARRAERKCPICGKAGATGPASP